MPLHVAVLDPLPMYRQGVVAVLGEAGYAVETPADLLDWLRRAERAVVLLTLQSADSVDLLRRLKKVPGDHHFIAVIDEGLFDQGIKALQAGACAVLWRTASPEALRRAVEGLAEGQAVLPVGLIPVLTGHSPRRVVGLNPLTADELRWLRQLAEGSTVSQVAAQSGYSERAMFRLLRHLYVKMEVTTRTQAILRAQEFGWLPEADARA